MSSIGALALVDCRQRFVQSFARGALPADFIRIRPEHLSIDHFAAGNSPCLLCCETAERDAVAQSIWIKPGSQCEARIIRHLVSHRRIIAGWACVKRQKYRIGLAV
jgi:hypothetical protein